jgi:PAS domain S-box-containing protein
MGTDAGERDAEVARLEAELRASEGRFAQAWEASFEGMALHEGGTLVEVNPAFCRMFGYERDEVLGRPALDLAAPESHELIRRSIESGRTEPYEAVGLRKDGSRFFADVAGRPVTYRGRPARLTVFRDVTSRRRAEEALRRTEESYRSLVENLTDVVITLDTRGVVTYISPALRNLSAYEPEDVIGRPFGDFVHPDDLVGAQASFVRTLAGQVDPWEFRARDKGGDYHWVRTAGRPVLERGQVVGLGGVLTDITDRKRAEVLRDGQGRVLEMIATNAPLPQTLAALARLIESQAEGMLCSVLLLDDDGVCVRHGAAPGLPAAFTRAIDGLAVGPQAGSCGAAMYLGKTVIAADVRTDPLWEEYRDLATSFGLRACWSTPILSHQGKVLGSFAMYYREPRVPGPAELRLLDAATHIAGIAIQRHRDEASLRQAEQKYRAIFDNAVEGIFQSTPGGRFLAVNPAMARIAGFAAPEEMVASITSIERQLFVDPRRRAEYLRLLHEQGSVRDFEFEIYRRDGSRRWVSEHSRAVRGAGGEVLYHEGTVQDITERKALQKQYLQAQKMEAVGRLAGGVAHDFNNLLTVINGYGRLLLGRLPADDPARHFVAEITAAGERAATLTRQLLAFSRQELVAPRVLDLREVVAETESMLRRVIGEDVEVVTASDPDLGGVRADPGQVVQVLMNLAVNARDAMPHGGQLTIETRNADLDGGRPGPAGPTGSEGPGAYVLLSVRDTGQGIPPEVLPRIWEPFFTTKERGRGTGLGLAVVDGIVQQAGGHAEVVSEPGRGTTFRLYFPRVEGRPGRGRSPSGVDAMPRGAETVLLVEDEDAVRALGRQVLAHCGYKVLEASDGETALRTAGDHAGPIDLLVTDVVLPGAGGREVAQRVAALRPGVRTLFLSGYTDDAVVRLGIREEQVAFLPKPFTPVQLARKVREVLDGNGRSVG